MRRGLIFTTALLALQTPSLADPAPDARFDFVVAPYVQSGQFSGAILVVRDGDVLFDRAYGMADSGAGIPNRPSTRFHIGTLSMQYTAVAIVHLAETHKLSLDNTADQFVPGAPAVTLRDLLAVAPAAPAAAGDYELLARVAEAATGKSFADVVDAGAVASVWESGTGLDDGTLGDESSFARGYQPSGAASADWHALTGAASAYTTTRDELHWLNRFFGDEMVSREDRLAMLSGSAGYGWFHGRPDAFWMAGRAPGFASYVLREGDLTVIVLANNGDAPAAKIGNGLASEALGRKGPPTRD